MTLSGLQGDEGLTFWGLPLHSLPLFLKSPNAPWSTSLGLASSPSSSDGGVLLPSCYLWRFLSLLPLFVSSAMRTCRVKIPGVPALGMWHRVPAFPKAKESWGAMSHTGAPAGAVSHMSAPALHFTVPAWRQG